MYQVCDGLPWGQLGSRGRPRRRRWGDRAASRLRRGRTSWRRGACGTNQRLWLALPSAHSDRDLHSTSSSNISTFTERGAVCRQALDWILWQKVTFVFASISSAELWVSVCRAGVFVWYFTILHFYKSISACTSKYGRWPLFSNFNAKKNLRPAVCVWYH